jgi:hypothetical protein
MHHHAYFTLHVFVKAKIIWNKNLYVFYLYGFITNPPPLFLLLIRNKIKIFQNISDQNKILKTICILLVAFCFFSDRTLHGVVSDGKFFWCSSTILPGKLSCPLPTYRGTYYLFVFMLYALCFMLAFPMLCLSYISYPPVSPKQNYIFATSRLLPFACCLSWPCES